MKQVYQITEYGSFITGRQLDGFVTLPGRTFDALEHFVLSARSGGTDALELMGISVKKGVGKVITARNHVGLLLMRDGTCIEILPKIDVPGGCGPAQAKRFLTDMLQTLRGLPFKSLQAASVDTARMSLFDIFVRLFLREVFALVKRGLPCGYRQAVSVRNQADLRTLLSAFDGVLPSDSPAQDFARTAQGRATAEYRSVLSWCRVFLAGKNFTPWSGSEVAQALLFPMDLLFEQYIAALVKQLLPSGGFHVSAQDKTFFLFNSPTEKFLLKPDLAITRRADGVIFLCDTKWKRLSADRPNHGISQADMYQMYAYHRKYHAASVTLLYPLCAGLTDGAVPAFVSDDGVLVNVRLLNLLDIRRSLERVLADFH